MYKYINMKDVLKSDSIYYDCLLWRGLIFWGFPNISFNGVYYKFEANSIRKCLTYRLSPITLHTKKPHISGWNLDIIRFGEINPVVRVSDHEKLRKSSFQELFAVMGILLDEEENPNLVENLTKTEFARIQRKWKRWMKVLPDWLNQTIAITESRIIPETKNSICK